MTAKIKYANNPVKASKIKRTNIEDRAKNKNRFSAR